MGEDNNGNRVEFEYDINEDIVLLKKVTAASGRYLTFVYNDTGLLIKVKDSLGRWQAYMYNDKDELIRTTDSFGAEEKNPSSDQQGQISVDSRLSN